MASQSAKNMLYCTCETGKLSGGAPGPVGSSPYGKISVCGRSMKKRILSCLMALALCLTLLPTAALAGETEGTAQDTLLGLSPRQEPPYGGCAPKHACGRRPAHTLYPQGGCSIRRAAKPLTAALPYRRGEFTTLSTDAFITLNGVVPILGQLHVYSGKIDICDRFAMQKHRRMKNVRFPRPCGATGNDTRTLHAPALRIFMARCSYVKFFA